jgi:hypothetical protein
MGLFSTKKSSSEATTISEDVRTAVETMGGGQFIGPKATFGQPGSITTGVGDYGTATLNLTGNKFQTGMTGAEVASLFAQQAVEQSAQLGTMKEFGQAAMASRAGEPIDWKSYIPYGIVLVVAYFALRRSP